MRVTAKAPYYTTFRRRVRWHRVELSLEFPREMAKELVRQELNGRRHTVDEASWSDQEDCDIDSPRHRRTLSVRFVTGGMRHGLGRSIELAPRVGQVEFARAHNLPRPAPLPEDDEPDLD